MIKKFLSLFLALALSIVLVACGSTGSENKGDESGSVDVEDIELTKEKFTVFIGNSAPSVAIEDTPIGKKILEELNVELEIEYGVGDVDTRLNLMMFSGDYPDIIVANSQDNQKKLIKAKALIDMEKYIGEDSTIRNAYKTDEYDLMGMIKNSMGGMYYLPYSVGGVSSTLTQAFYIQIKALKDNGYPEITTVDQYFSLIESYKKANPNLQGLGTIGFTMQNETTDLWRFDNITNPVLSINGYQNDGGWFVDKGEDGKYTVRAQAGSDEEYQYLKKLNEFYNKGLVDTEFVTQKLDDWNAKMLSGRVVGYYGWGYEVDGINHDLALAGLEEYCFVPVRLLNEGVTSDKYNSPSLPDISKGMGVTVNCKNPARAVKMLSMLLEEDIYKLRKWGEEGVDYNLDLDGKVIMDKDAYRYWCNTPVLEQRGLVGATFLGFPERPYSFNFANGMTSYPALDPRFKSYDISDLDKEYLGIYGYNDYSEMFDTFDMPYGYAYTVANGFDVNSTERKTINAIDDVVMQYITALIRCKTSDFESIWAEYESKLASLSTGSLSAIEAKMAEEINKRIDEGRFA